MPRITGVSTLPELLHRRAREQPGREACTFLKDGETEEGSFTYGRLDRRARALGALLQGRAAAGDRILLLYPPGLEYVAAFLACQYAGMVPVPAYPPTADRRDREDRGLPRLRAIAADAGVDLALTTAAVAARRAATADPELARPSWLATDGIDEMAEEELAGQWREPAAGGSDIAFLQYTSGSTADPKGVMVTHRNLLHNLEWIQRRFEHTPASRAVIWLPPYHDMGLIGGILQPLYAGFPVVLLSPAAFLQRPVRWLQAVSRYRGTTSGGPDFAYELCARRITPEQRAGLDLSSWDVAFDGAEPVRPETLDRFCEAFAPCGFRREALYPCYGLAEGTLLAAGGRKAEAPAVLAVRREDLARGLVRPASEEEGRRLTGCGAALGDGEIAVVDPETGQRCGPGRIGEIWTAGPSVARGYWNRPDETRATFGARLADGGGPYLRTGDLGFLEGGELFVTGRLKDLIVLDGLKHHPEDLERTAEASHPALRPGGCAAFPVEEDGAERLVIAAELDRRRAGEALETEEVVRAVRRAVAEWHGARVHDVVLLPAGRLPRTTSGKLRRHACRELRPAGSRPCISAAATGLGINAIQDRLIRELSARLGVAPSALDPGEPFASYGLSSREAVSLAGDLESWLGRPLSPALLWQQPTVEALARHLAGEAEDRPRERAAETPPADGAEPVAVVGIGCRFPGASGPAELWRLLAEGRDAVGEAPAWRRDPSEAGRAHRGGFLDGVDLFDAPFFGVSPAEATRMDPQQRLLLEVAWEALEDAGIPADRLAGTAAGVFVGISNSDYSRLQPAFDAWTGTGNALSIAANRIFYALDLRGPSLAVDTACSSSLVAVHLACRSLRAGECDVALAGGVNLVLDPALTRSLSAAGMTAADGRCKTFDAAADGYVRGEGCGVVVLMRLADARRYGRDSGRDSDRVRAVIRGTAINQDGRSNGLTAPSQAAQEEVVRRALADAGLAAERVGYVECHGSGTPLGDLIEVQALAAVLGGREPGAPPCRLGSIKTNLGHLEAAAGIAGLVKAVLTLEHGAVPPHLHLRRVHPDLDAADGARRSLEIEGAGRSWPAGGAPRVAGVSSFGFGGSNAHVVLEEAPATEASGEEQPARPWHLLALSAKTETALAELARRYAQRLEAQPGGTAELCAAAATGRSHLSHRLAAVANSGEELRGRLEAFAAGAEAPGVRSGRSRGRRRPRIAFLFTGQPAQYPGMGRGLFAAEPVFRRAIEECDEGLRPWLDQPLLSLLDPSEGAVAALDDTACAQPALFALEIALARLWRSWGIEPDAVLGHSAGECAAACVAGALDLADGLRLIAERGRSMGALPPGGGMAVAFAGEEQVAAVISEIAAAGRTLTIAAVNGPHNTVVSGDREAVSELLARLQAAGIEARVLPVAHAFHSELVEPALDGFERSLADLTFREPRIPLVSGRTGRPLAAGEVPDAAWWRRQMREPVRFADGIDALLAGGCEVFLEIGPRPDLTRMAAGPAEDRAALFVPSLRRGQDDTRALLDSLGRLYTAGADVDWAAFHRGRPRHRLALPLYPFERKRYWITGRSLPREEGETTVTTPFAAIGAIAAIADTAPPRSARQDRIAADLAAVTARLLEAEPAAVDLHMPFLEMGADSIVLVQALRAFEDTYGLKLTIRQLFEELSTLDALAAHIDANLPPDTEAPPAHAPADAPPAVHAGHLTPRQRHHLEELTARYTRRTRRSKEAAAAHRPVLADSRAASNFRLSVKEMFYPVTGARSLGARLWDIDGNEYVDLTMGFGVHLFGHGAPFLTAAIEEQLREGIQLGPRAALAGEVAERIAALTGCERAAFCNSGTEAVTVAVRLARAATGRTRIALFADSYHGHSDLTQARARAGAEAPWGVPAVPGVPEATAADVLVLDYADPRALEILAAHGRDLAAVLVEPVQGRRPDLQPRELLHRLRAWTAEAGVPLIFDEMVTGFRVHPAGAQGWLGVRADLAAYGKVLGGGLPIGVVAGKAEYLDRIDGGAWRYGDRSFPAVEATLYGGTYCQHPLALAAARAVLRRLEEQGPALQEQLNRRTEDFAAALDAVFAERGAPVRVARFGSLFRFTAATNQDLFYYHLLDKGVFVSERRQCFLSTAHTDEDLEHVLRAVRESVEALQDGGFLPEASAPVRPVTVPEARLEPWRRKARPSLTAAAAPAVERPARPLAFSLSFFGSPGAEGEAGHYSLILEAAKAADRQGFDAVWVPERHFHGFGGFSPSPAVLHAALARETSRVGLRAGSVVLPLHHPVRVAEEWAMVDHLSGGRVGVSFASGWHPQDFALSPAAWDRRRELLFEGIETVRRLWRGESLRLPDGAGGEAGIRLFPRPVQAELPVWVTAVNNPETFARAGEIGAGILTNLMGQNVDDLARNVALYRAALAASPGTANGRVTVLLHTFLGADLGDTRQRAEGPFCDYLASSIDLFRGFARSQGLDLDSRRLDRLGREDLAPLLRAAYERYVRTSALIGTPESCAAVLARLAEIGVDEVACLVDFGLGAPDVLAGLAHLGELREVHERAFLPAAAPPPETSAALTDGQRLLWTLSRMDEAGSAAYNECVILRRSPAGAIDPGAAHLALRRLVERHEALRTTFPEDGGDARIAPAGGIALETVELPAAGDPEENLLDWLRAGRRQVFDLAGGPLWRASLVRRGPDGDALVIFAHHLIVDGWSFGVLLRDLAAGYAAALSGRDESRPAPMQPREYARLQAEQLASPALAAQEAYWCERFAGGVPALELPADRPRPAAPSYRGAAFGTALGPALREALQEAARRERCTPFMVLAAAYLLLLHRLSGQPDAVLGVDVAGRPFAGSEDLVGYCTHLVMVRSRPAGSETFREHLAAVRSSLLACFENQDVPFARLVRKLALARDPSRPLPVATTLNLDRPLDLPAGFALDFERISRSAVHSQVDLSVNAVEASGGDLRLDWTYAADRFDAATAQRMAGAFRTLLANALADPECRAVEIGLLAEAGRRQIFAEWNDTDADLPDLAFPERFVARAALHPAAVAAVCDGETLSYGELARRSEHLARRLAAYGAGYGAGAEAPVALLAERGLDFLVAVIAILRAGGAYLPLDPRSPARRLGRMLERSAARLLLSAAGLLDAAAEAAGEILEARRPRILDLEAELAAPDAAAALPASIPPDHLAYVLHTSGSTGEPKGAMIAHRGLANHLLAKTESLGLTARDTVAQTAPATFDVSIWQLLAPLLSGGRVCILRDEVVADPAALLRRVRDEGVTALEIVPSLLRPLLAHVRAVWPDRPDLRSLRWLIPTGETLPSAACREWMSYYPSVAVLNAYGPTECSDDVAHGRVRRPEEGASPVPVGRPVRNLRLYVLDAALVPLPIGVPGELCAGGAGVGRGYLGDPAATAQAFVPDPFGGEAGARLYRTGDRARLRPDGEIEVLGRTDRQVKLLGLRVELGEIEAALARHPAVAQCATAVWEGTEGEPVLAAYAVVRPGCSQDAASLRAFLQSALPPRMVPADFVFLDALPLTAHGKLDRAALPRPGAAKPRVKRAYIPPETRTEQGVAQVLEQALRGARIGLHDDFFDLGGDSLELLKVASSLGQFFQVKLPLRRVFLDPSVAALARLVEQRRAPAASI